MRKLTTRERVLLVCLAVVAVISGYVMLFYMPITQQMDTLTAQIAQDQELASQMEAKLEHQRQMERELDQLAGQADAAPQMPEYDNLQAVMVELNAILAPCREYSLSFQEEQGEGNVFCRRVSIPFTCSSYQQARQVLQALHDSALRGLLQDVQIDQQEDGAVHVNAAMTFYEYREVQEEAS